MERVEFQQEDMVAELKDLEEKGLFSKSEVKIIMKKRTAFEASLIRRIPKKVDYLRYAEYEMQLEALRRRRLQRLKNKDTMPSISDYAMVRRQFYIFERALRKFKADVGLWVQYIELAKKERATGLVGRISARALQLHPNEPSLYVYAAQYELENSSPAAARALLQRGLRLNKDTERLWMEYVKFELGFVEMLRQRWKTLGVTGTAEDEGEDARKEILQGGIVRAVMEEAVKAKPTGELFKLLDSMLADYPTPLRESMLEHLHTLLRKTLPNDPTGLKLRARRLLPEDVEDVEKLGVGNEELLIQAREQGGAVSAAYAEVIQEWCQRDLEPSLRQYLIACLQSLTASKRPAPSVLATHVRLLSKDAATLDGAVARARKYTAGAGAADADVWLARLEAERLAGTTAEEMTRIWETARRTVKSDGPEGERIWRWGLAGENDQLLESLLRQSRAMNRLWIHGRLAMEYYVADHTPQTRLSRLRRVVREWCVSEEFFPMAFAHEAGREDASEAVLEEVYKEWVGRNKRAAGLAWARWLLEHGDGGRAMEVIGRTRGVDQEWMEIVNVVS